MTDKAIATIAVAIVAVILATSAGARWAVTGDVSSEMITILATLAGVLLGVPVGNGAVRRINNKTK